MANPTIIVEFGEHVALDSVASMVTGIAAYGDVDGCGEDRKIAVRVFRPSKLGGLKNKLLHLERYGFLRWRQAD